MKCRLKRLWRQLKHIVGNKIGSGQLPDKLIKEMARCLLPDLIAYCESEEGKAAFEEWKANQEAEKEKSKA